MSSSVQQSWFWGTFLSPQDPNTFNNYGAGQMGPDVVSVASAELCLCLER